MCSIVAGFNTEKIKQLCQENHYRGSLNHSITYIRLDGSLISLDRYSGPLDIEEINIPQDSFVIIHQQAPTQQSKFIHPAEYNGAFLWHNGILKSETVKKLQKKHHSQSEWDTQLLLYEVCSEEYDNLDGSFACVLYDNHNVYVFRNDLSPLFYDEDLNLSSTKFNNSESLPANNFCLLDLVNRKIEPYFNFKTVENPYFFFDED